VPAARHGLVNAGARVSLTDGGAASASFPRTSLSPRGSCISSTWHFIKCMLGGTQMVARAASFSQVSSASVGSGWSTAGLPRVPNSHSVTSSGGMPDIETKKGPALISIVDRLKHGCPGTALMKQSDNIKARATGQSSYPCRGCTWTARCQELRTTAARTVPSR
jgi:hypothetical protein